MPIGSHVIRKKKKINFFVSKTALHFLEVVSIILNINWKFSERYFSDISCYLYLYKINQSVIKQYTIRKKSI